MKLVRSWPRHPRNPDQPHVVDSVERVYVDDYDYTPLVDVGDDVLHLDWDTAVSREDVVAFAAAARRRPGSVLVAPVPVYPESRRGLRRPVWNLKRYQAGGTMRHVTESDATCHLFGFGMVYLPRDLIAAFVATGARFGDIEFAGWHHQEVEAEVPIAWQVRPVHLHCRLEQVPL